MCNFACNSKIVLLDNANPFCELTLVKRYAIKMWYFLTKENCT